MMTLYDTATSLVALDELLETPITPEIEAALVATLNAHVAKVDAVSRYLANLEHLEQAAIDEGGRLERRAASFKAKRQRLEEYVLRVLEVTGFPALQGETSTLKARNNPPAVEITDEKAIPAEYIKITQPAPTTMIDKKAIGAALNAGEHVPGARRIQRVKLVRE